MKRGSKINFIAAFDKMSDPILSDGRTSVGYEENSHAVNIPEVALVSKP